MLNFIRKYLYLIISFTTFLSLFSYLYINYLDIKYTNKKSEFSFFYAIFIPFRLSYTLKVFNNLPLLVLTFSILKVLKYFCGKNLLTQFETFFSLKEHQQRGYTLIKIVISSLILPALVGLISLVEKFFINKSYKSIKEYITCYVMNKKSKFFIQHPRGVVLDRLDDCYDKVKELIDYFIDVFDTFVNFFSFLFSINNFLIVCNIDTLEKKITFFLLIFSYFILFYIFTYSLSKEISNNSNKNSKFSTHTQQKITDSINNINHIKNTGTEYEIYSFLKKYIDKEFKLNSNFSRSYIKLQAFTSYLAEIPIICITFWLFYIYIGKVEEINIVPGSLTQVMSFRDTIRSINDLIESTSFQFENSNKFYDSLFLFTDGNIESIFNFDINKNKRIAELEDVKIDNCTIQMSNVVVKDFKQHNIIDKVNLNIKPGEHIAIVGSSGSGKSTLINIIMNIVEPNSGKVTINGKIINSYKKQIFFNTFNFIPQDNNLFNRSIKENIMLDRKINDNDINRSCQLAECYDLINALPQKFDFKVGNNGERLSGGQKQRIVISRNLVRKNPNVLILDEATSALDLKTEKDVLENIMNFYNDKTIIKISHRLNFLQKYPNFRILVMNKGSIVQDGNLNDLISDKEGVFYKIWLNANQE